VAVGGYFKNIDQEHFKEYR